VDARRARLIKTALMWMAFTLFIAGIVTWSASRSCAHDAYTKWMQPHRPGTSCCSNQDCAPVHARFDEQRKLYEAQIDGEWRAIPPHIILDPKKPENATPDGSFHACWNRRTGELLCFRTAEPKI
jgi:hypothetical protein